MKVGDLVRAKHADEKLGLGMITKVDRTASYPFKLRLWVKLQGMKSYSSFPFLEYQLEVINEHR